MTKLFEYEARFKNNNILINFGTHDELAKKDEDIAKNFFGNVFSVVSSDSGMVVDGLPSDFSGMSVFLCGNLNSTAIASITINLRGAERVLIVGDLSQGYGQETTTTAKQPWQIVGSGRVPIFVHDEHHNVPLGVLFREFFPSDRDLYKDIVTAHPFHSLTASNKPGVAYREGTYVTRVRKDEDGRRHYKLLRCSTNMAGPTDDFHEVDEYIAGELNKEAKFIFDDPAELNHGLAQIYHNRPAPASANSSSSHDVASSDSDSTPTKDAKRTTTTKKQVKSKIKAHADKTKDMTITKGIMAFVSLYKDREKLKPMMAASEGKPFQYGHKNVSSLTELKFRLKKMTLERPECAFLTPIFSVPLAPNSVFFMPLSTNRWYTHEICPSPLDACMLPTRLGYVFRCSSTDAIYDPKDGNTYIKEDNNGGLKKLEPATKEDLRDLSLLYREENISDDFIDYGKKYFSMNKGDYLPPTLAAERGIVS